MTIPTHGAHQPRRSPLCPAIRSPATAAPATTPKTSRRSWAIPYRSLLAPETIWLLVSSIAATVSTEPGRKLMSGGTRTCRGLSPSHG
ncbi:hypothetical protein D3C74_393590 [compost metagenome]